jgi:hypothetical protein
MIDRIASLLLINNDERGKLGYLLLVFVLMGAGMALGRGTADALFFKRYGIEYLPIMFILVSLLLSTVSVLYAAFVDALPAERFFKIIFAVMIVLLVGFWLMMNAGVTDQVYPAYFLVYEVISELFLVHSALYLGQNLVQTQSKRLMPIILAGSQVGVMLGGVFLASMSSVIGVQNMLLVWSVIIGVTFVLVISWHRDKGVSPYFRAGRKERSRLKQSINQVTQGVRFLKTSELLKMSSFALFFMVISTYVLCYTLNKIYTSTFETEESLSAFFGLLTAVTSGFALFMQVFVSNRVIRRFGVKKINLVYPFTSFLVYGGLLFSFTLPVALIGSFNKDAIMPAFRRPVRNIFMEALPMQIQGRARAMSIVIVLPLALATAGAFLWVAQKADDPSLFLYPGMLAALTYLWFNRKMNRAYAAEIIKNLKQRLFVPDQQLKGVLADADAELIGDIEKGVLQEDEEISIAYSRVLSRAKPERAVNLIPRRMQSASVVAKDQMIKMLQPLESKMLRDQLRTEIGNGDSHLDATLYKALFESSDEESKEKVSELLNSDSPRLQSAAIMGALIYPLPEHEEQAIKQWTALLSDSRPEYYMPGIELVMPGLERYYLSEPVFEALQRVVVQMLNTADSRIQLYALKILADWPTDDFKAAQESVQRLFSHADWKVRAQCIRALHILPYDDREQLIGQAIEDAHPEVREAAIICMSMKHKDPQQWLAELLTEKQFGSPRARETIINHLIDMGSSAEMMYSVAMAMARSAEQARDAAAVMAQEESHYTPGLLLLRHALEERMNELIDLSLLSIQASTHDSEIEVIRAGLKSRDKRHFANACELLSMIQHGGLSTLLLQLCDSDSGNRAVHGQRFFKSLDDVLEWIGKSTDPWLNECADYLNTTLTSKCHV